MLIGYNLLRKDGRYKGAKTANLLAVEALVTAGCDKIYLDFIGQEKTQLALVLNRLKTGDILMVPRSQILGESRASFLQTIQTLQRQGVHLQSLEENYLFPSSFSLLDWLELSTQLFPDEELTRSNYQPIPLPQKSPKDGGRPALPEEQKELIRLLKLVRINQKKINISKICRLASVCRQSYYNLFPPHQKSA